MDLTKLIAEAWESERAKYRIIRNSQGFPPRLARKHPRDDPGFTGTDAECEAHLSRLCALAVLRALQENGMIIAEPYHTTGDGGWSETAYEDLIPAALDQP